jgi:hypothetical protein
MIGSSAWWQELGTLTEPAPPPEQPKGRRRGKRAVAGKSGNADPSIRADLVARVRREIAAGVYDTPEKWDAALDRLLERLDQV